MTLLVVNLVLTAAYAGFQWTVRVLVYPQFAQVPPDAFAAYERSHQRRVTRVVGPLFVGQGATTLALLAMRPAGMPLAPVLAGAACLAAVLGVTALLAVLASAACLAVVLELTALGAVPQHRRLDRGWDPAVHRRLVHVDTLRALTATVGVAAALWLVLAGTA